MKLTFIPFEIGNIVLFENVSECQNSILLYIINENKTFFQHVFRHKMEENVIANLFA